MAAGSQALRALRILGRHHGVSALLNGELSMIERVTGQRTLHSSSGSCANSGSEKLTKPVQGDLYNREERNPDHSSTPGVTQSTFGKESEGLDDGDAYPIQNDPSAPGSAPNTKPGMAGSSAAGKSGAEQAAENKDIKAAHDGTQSAV